MKDLEDRLHRESVRLMRQRDLIVESRGRIGILRCLLAGVLENSPTEINAPGGMHLVTARRYVREFPGLSLRHNGVLVEPLEDDDETL